VVGQDAGITLRRSGDDGSTFDSAITLSDKDKDSQNPQMAVSRDNSVYLAWDNNATGNEEILLYKANPKNIQLNSSKSIQKDTGLQSMIVNVLTKKPKRIALVGNTFTRAAYNSAFYLFYNIKSDTSANITKYTNLLSSKDSKECTILKHFEPIVDHLKWLRSCIHLITFESCS
jgi:hypothetical protein